MATMIRVILNDECRMNILMANGKSVVCTAKALRDVLTYPKKFYDEKYREYYPAGHEFLEKNTSIDDLPGLTMLTVSFYNEIKGNFPVLFRLLFENLDQKNSNQLYVAPEALGNHAEDEADFWFKYYLELAKYRHDGFIIENPQNYPTDLRYQFIKDIANTHFNQVSVDQSIETSVDAIQNSTNTKPDNTKVQAEPILTEPVAAVEQTALTPDHIPLIKWAEKNGYKYVTVIAWARQGKLASAIQIKRKWYVLAYDKPQYVRGSEKPPIVPGPKSRFNPATASYTEWQKYIQDNNYFTDAVRPYFRTFKEFLYFREHKYKEVAWDGYKYLIIDINPEYSCEAKGLTNRELIERGESPVVPGDPQNRIFHLHHIGQKSDSPLAIVPQEDHLGQFSLFHQKASGENLHDKQFDLMRIMFWKKYLEVYDAAGCYKNIKHDNYIMPGLKPRKKGIMNGS